MVTFTINIPHMLAYIAAPWILWAISHHIRLYSLDLRDIPSGNAGNAHHFHIISPSHIHHKKIPWSPIFLPSISMDFPILWEFPIATLGSVGNLHRLLSYMLIYRSEYI
jgi:hypothetical protein